MAMRMNGRLTARCTTAISWGPRLLNHVMSLRQSDGQLSCTIYLYTIMLAVGSAEENVCTVVTYVSGIFPVIAASFFRELNLMQAGRYELSILSTIVRIVVPAVSIRVFVHIIHDGADLYFEA